MQKLTKKDRKKTNVGLDFNNRKPPLPTISRKDGLNERCSSWNNIHMSDIFSLNGSDDKNDEKRSNENSVLHFFHKSKKLPSPSSRKSFLLNTNNNYLSPYNSASDMKKKGFESFNSINSTIDNLTTKKNIFKTSVFNYKFSSSYKCHSVKSFGELCKEPNHHIFFK